MVPVGWEPGRGPWQKKEIPNVYERLRPDGYNPSGGMDMEGQLFREREEGRLRVVGRQRLDGRKAVRGRSFRLRRRNISLAGAHARAGLRLEPVG